MPWFLHECLKALNLIFRWRNDPRVHRVSFTFNSDTGRSFIRKLNQWLIEEYLPAGL
jgi:hypothetical protein